MTSSLRALLTGLIDYAGLFPPAGLGMEEAVRNYAGYITGEHAWMLGRFVLPASRLDEFAEAYGRLDAKGRWRLSALVTAEDVGVVRAFNDKYSANGPVVDAVELNAGGADEIRASRQDFGPSMAVFVEVPLAEAPDLLPAIAGAEAYAKLRTGGTVSAAIPSTGAVFAFLQSDIGTGVPFKATAGLHHPVRGERPLTYERNAVRGTMHGFVNLFVAAVVLYNRVNDDDALSILNETDPGAFVFDGDELRWRDRVTLAAERIAEARRLALSFGSCSFTEPVQELQALGWLPR